MIAGAAVSDSLHSEVNMPNWVLCAVVAVDKKQEPGLENPTEEIADFHSSFFLMQQILSHHLNHNRYSHKTLTP